MARSKLALMAAMLVFGLGLAACGDTWRGVKEDTRENTQAVGQGVERAGEKIQQQTR
jgi:predicted small secreted protein